MPPTHLDQDVATSCVGVSIVVAPSYRRPRYRSCRGQSTRTTSRRTVPRRRRVPSDVCTEEQQLRRPGPGRTAVIEELGGRLRETCGTWRLAATPTISTERPVGSAESAADSPPARANSGRTKVWFAMATRGVSAVSVRTERPAADDANTECVSKYPFVNPCRAHAHVTRTPRGSWNAFRRHEHILDADLVAIGADDVSATARDTRQVLERAPSTADRSWSVRWLSS